MMINILELTETSKKTTRNTTQVAVTIRVVRAY